MPKPKLSQNFADGLAIAAKNRGWHAYIPYALLTCLILGLILAYFIPEKLWNETDTSNGLTVYGGLLAFNSLLLAIGWSTFAKLYELIGSGPFSKFLKRNGILKYHILFVEISQFTLVFSSVISGFGMFSILLPFSLITDRLILATAVGFSLYALVKCIQCTQAMHDILWEAAEFDSDTDCGEKITPIRNGN